MNRFWNLIKGCLPSAGRQNLQDFLHSTERMRAILDRERMRSDRGSSSFAMLTLTLSPHAEEGDYRTLALTVRDRIRATDDAGQLGPRSIGIVLPETSAAGGWKLAESICELLPEDMRRPRCEVFVYPSDKEPAEIGQERIEEPHARRPTRSMHALFCQPLPAWKRALDVLGAGTLLVLTAPVMLAAVAAIKITSPGPIVFKQRRDTLGGRPFTIYKFRTMTVDADARKAELRKDSEQDGPAFKLKNDPRVTPIGRWLRRTCIDELPQVFNVLMGDMTLVGPRAMDSNESLRCEPWQRRRLDVTAGLTCIWQVYGGTKVTFAEWMRMDLRYACSRSLWKDLRLMALTAPSIIRRDGVY